MGHVEWGGSAGEHRGEVHHVSKVAGKCLCWLPQVSSCLGCTGRGEIWHLSALLFLENSPEDPCLFSTCSEISINKSFMYILGTFQTAASMSYLRGIACDMLSL